MNFNKKKNNFQKNSFLAKNHAIKAVIFLILMFILIIFYFNTKMSKIIAKKKIIKNILNCAKFSHCVKQNSFSVIALFFHFLF